MLSFLLCPTINSVPSGRLTNEFAVSNLVVPIFFTSLISPLEEIFDKTISDEPNAFKILPLLLKELPKMRKSPDGSSMTDVPQSYSVPPIDFSQINLPFLSILITQISYPPFGFFIS